MGSDYLHTGAKAAGLPAVDPCLDKPWKCKRCSALLGYCMDVDDKSHLRIRYKDFYVKVVEPEVITVLCRRCSYDNSLYQRGSEPVDAPSASVSGGSSATTPTSVQPAGGRGRGVAAAS